MRSPRLLTTPARSALMSQIRSADTKPELSVRRALHRLGYRFRLHVRGLPGSPDIVLPKHRTIIQVKGCFWHRHSCIGERFPRTNSHFWIPKLIRNCERDEVNERKLRRLGWSVHSLWECRIKKWSDERLEETLQRILPK